MKLQHKKIVLNQNFSYNFGGVYRIMFINETEDCNGDITNVLLLLSFSKSDKPGLQGTPLLHVPDEYRKHSPLRSQCSSKLGVLEGHGL